MKKILSLLAILMVAMTAWAIDPVKPNEGTGSDNNPYRIATAGNLVWFAQQVNGGNGQIHAKLTADIDLGSDQTMIGTSDHMYNAVFDGDGHTVTVNYTAKESHTALFRYVTWSTIKNLKVAGSISTGYKFAGGIVAECQGTTYITNCSSSVAITSTFTTAQDGTHGGIVARCLQTTNTDQTIYLTNVVFNGELLGQNATHCGGLIGWSQASANITTSIFCPHKMSFGSSNAATMSRGNGVTVTYSYYSTTLGTAQGTAGGNDMVNGALCYKLNKGDVYGTQIWYQNIDNGKTFDASPVLDKTHGTVYGGEDQCPQNTYSNTLRGHDGSMGDDGIIESCTNERCYRTNVYQCPSIVDGIYQINNISNLIWFANKVSEGKTNLNAKLTADIDLGTTQTMIGTSTNKYVGTFDGDGHTITVNYNTSETATALFRYVGNAVIKNLMTSGTITTSGNKAAGVVGVAESLALNCVTSDVAINSSYSGDSSHGGLVAEITPASLAFLGSAVLSNCAFTGKLLGAKTEKCGGLIGWKGYATVSITNCYVDIAEQTVITTDCQTLVRSEGNAPTINNCYYVTALGGAQGTKITADAITSGEACYKLNGGKVDGSQKWYQNLDTEKVDAKPVPFNTHATVYGGEDQCPAGLYSNTSHAHSYSAEYGADGIAHCTNTGCNSVTEEAPEKDASGTYLIANKGNLIWFAQQVNAGQTGINGMLTADIDMGDDQTMIGTSTKKYAGTFDGDGHSITVNYTATEDVTALFRYVGTATIKNLTTSGTITTSGKQAAGIASKAESLTLDCVMSDVTISSSYSGDSSHGGLVAEVSSTSTLTNCAFIGKLLGENTEKCGGLIGWEEDANVTITNCYVDIAQQTVKTADCKTLARYRSTAPTIKDCYYVTALGEVQGTAIAAEAVASGELCYLVNGGKTDGSQSWYQNVDNSQTIDARPVLSHTHGTVYGGEDQCPPNTYSNTFHAHNFCHYGAEGVAHCTNNGCSRIVYQPAEQDASGYYLIGKKGNLIWFAQQVNAGHTGLKGKLTSDIDLGDDQTMIGTSTNMYAATFDGNGYCVTVNYTATEDVTALFRYVGNSTIKNLMTSGTITTSGRHAAGVVGKAENVKLENVISNMTIDSSHSGDSSHGGLVAEISNGSFTNCAFIGKLLGENTSHCGGLVGWVVYSNNFYMTNCYVDIAEQTISTSNCNTLSRNYNYKILNCYYVTALGSAQGTQVDASAVTNGSLVDKLDNTVWSQDAELGTPVPFFLNTQFGKYLKLTALEDGSITIQQTGTVTATLEYITEGATAWTDVTYDSPISLTEGSGIYLRAKGVNGKNAKLSENSDNYLTFTSTMDFEASQNIMSLLDASCKLREVPKNAFYKLFYGCSHLTQAPKLPATALHDGSYQSMFQNCTNLTTIPDLSHVTIPYDCKEACKTMFSGCSNLKVNTLGLGSEWVIQTENEYADKTYGCFFQIFSRTGGNFTGRPQKDVTYYIYDDEPYTRQMTNEWGTLVLPFDVAYDATNTNHKLYHLTAADSKSLTFAEYATGTIPAGTPMAVKAIGDQTNGKYTISIPSAKGKFSGAITEQNSTNASLPADWTMSGTYSNLTGQTGIYFIAQGKFWYAEDAITIAPFRAWFTGPSFTGSAKAFDIIIDEDEVTRITNPNGNSNRNSKYLENGRVVIVKNGKKYNLNGQGIK